MAPNLLHDELAIRCRGLSKAYPPLRRLGAFTAAFRRPTTWSDDDLALVDVDLDVPKGQALGIIGPNGAGKSTLLKVIAQLTSPSAGSLSLDGSVRSVIELEAGFHPGLTGEENVRCLGVLHGRSSTQIAASLPRIAEFADIGDAIGRPIKHYSLGMVARLAFAAVTDWRPDVLVVDEVLSVGDQEFQARCLDRIRHMVDVGTTLVFVSHEMPLVAAVCDRVVQLRHGRLVDDGPPALVIERYLSRSTSGFARAEHSSVQVRRSGIEVGITAANSLRLWAELDVLEPVPHPAVSVDMVLPLVDPDNVVTTSTAELPPIGDPGRYRITGSTDSLGGSGRNLRFKVTVADHARREALDTISLDAEAVGDLDGLRLGPLGVSMTFPVTWAMERETLTTSIPAAAAPSPAENPVVQLRGVSKHYRTRGNSAAVHAALPGAFGELRDHDVVALDGLDLDIGRGEALGLIGPNASGKTTLLRVIAGVTEPVAGTVAVHGSIVPLLELGPAFHPELTGRENLEVLGRIMGLAVHDLADHVDEAVAFAALEGVANQPLKTYSTGMIARLGLSMALVLPADVILIDEVLAVGDEEFRRKAIARLAQRRHDGLTIVFVSHDLQLVEQVCDRVVRLHKGRCVDDGPTDEVVGGYAGQSWAGGVRDAEGGVRILNLEVDRRRVAPGGTLTLDGTLVVDEPVPGARLELALRAPRMDHESFVTIEERATMSVMMHTLVPRGRDLLHPGTYRFHCVLEAANLIGEVDVVLSAIDDDEAVVLAEVWQRVVIGVAERGVNLTSDMGLSWSVEPC